MLTRRSFIKNMTLGISTLFIAPSITINELTKAPVCPDITCWASWNMNDANPIQDIRLAMEIIKNSTGVSND